MNFDWSKESSNRILRSRSTAFIFKNDRLWLCMQSAQYSYRSDSSLERRTSRSLKDSYNRILMMPLCNLSVQDTVILLSLIFDTNVDKY